MSGGGGPDKSGWVRLGRVGPGASSGWVGLGQGVGAGALVSGGRDLTINKEVKGSGRVGLGWVGSGCRVGLGRVGLGRVGSGRVKVLAPVWNG